MAGFPRAMAHAGVYAFGKNTVSRILSYYLTFQNLVMFSTPIVPSHSFLFCYFLRRITYDVAIVASIL